MSRPAGSPYLVFYDGDCGLCDWTVQRLLRLDRAGILAYAPLQGPTAREWLGPIEAFDTMAFVDRSAPGRPRTWTRSRAALEILHRLGGPWRAITWMRFLPPWLIDPPYRVVARHRVKWFGRLDRCRVPDAAVKERFLP